VYRRTHPKLFGDAGNPILNQLKKERVDNIITHEEMDDYFKVNYTIMVLNSDTKDQTEGIGRILYKENV